VSSLDLATLAVLAIAGAGLAAGSIVAIRRRSNAGGAGGAGVDRRTVLARGGSYAALAVLLVFSARAGVLGVALLVAVLGAAALVEWGRLFDLPPHHRWSIVIAHLVIVAAIARGGVGAADSLVAGVVLVGAAWPVIRVDTGRAVRDLGVSAVGLVLVSVLLVHAVALVVERGELGAALFVALAVGCAGSDVGAFVVGRRFGRTPLAPRLSPNKTRAGLVGNLLGAAIALGLFAPALSRFGPAFLVLLVPLVAAGSVWGDLLESAIKREAGVKDTAAWLPGFGGILDRIDSLLITVALGYWAARLLGGA
jgi:phosphatidate cytidylyltransferase